MKVLQGKQDKSFLIYRVSKNIECKKIRLIKFSVSLLWLDCFLSIIRLFLIRKLICEKRYAFLYETFFFSYKSFAKIMSKKWLNLAKIFNLS